MSQPCPRCQRVLDLPGTVAFCPYCGHTLEPEVDPAGTTTPGRDSSGGAEVPEQLGDYRLLRHLGQGGMGVVYEGEHVVTGHRVAVKLIDVEAAPADALERFRQEGRLASAISHPRSVFVYAADQDAGRPFIVLELMPGQTLDDLVRQRGPLSVGEAISHALDLIEGLEQVHALGVIHRDVKPSNCFLDHDGRVKIGDFGLARLLQPQVRLTQTGTFVGTPLYASPEQIRGQPLDVRADVYSVCATLFFLLTGHAPHEQEGAGGLDFFARVVAEDAPPLRSRRPDLPAGLERILARGLSRAREGRHTDLAALRDELEAFRPATAGVEILGHRFAAYAVDGLLLGPPIWTLQVAFVLPHLPNLEAVGAAADLRLQIICHLLVLLYFGVAEGRWGATPGKWLLGLRVRRANDGRPPGVPLGLLRTAIWIALSLPLTAVVVLTTPTRIESVEGYLLRSSLVYVLNVGLLLCTIRPRNGYRLLHDVLSRTRVVFAPQQRPLSVRFGTLPPAAETSGGSVRWVGPYQVRRELWREGQQCILRADDPALDREVWLWLRPLELPAVHDDRRQSARRTRPRWLAAGTDGPCRWDAFLVPADRPLLDAVASHGKLTWEQARPILLELASELAEVEGRSFSLSQVWLAPQGRVVLVDLPLAGEPLSGQDLLAEAAVVLLEGGPMNPQRKQRPRGPLPGHARRLFACLPRFGGSGGVSRFREQGEQARDAPARTSLRARLAHLSLLAAFPLFGYASAWFLALMGNTIATLEASSPIDASHDVVAALDREQADEEQRQAAMDEARPRHRLGCAVALVAPTMLPTTRLAPAFEFKKQGYYQFVPEPSASQQRATNAAAFVAPTMLPATRLGPAFGLWRFTGRFVWAWYEPVPPSRARQLRELRDALAAAVARFEPYRDARNAPLWPFGQFLVRQSRETARQQLPRPGSKTSLEADAYFHIQFQRERAPPDVKGQLILLAVLLGASVVPSVLSALLFRGGLRNLFVGIDVVTGDGRQAGQLRCAWRALVAWAPLVVPLFLARWVEERYWSQWTPQGGPTWMLWTADVCWVLAIVLPLACLVLILLTPARSLHDRLSGTWLVPR